MVVEKPNFIDHIIYSVFGGAFGFVLSFCVLFFLVFNQATFWVSVGAVTIACAFLSAWKRNAFWRSLADNPIYQSLRFWG
jgi:hypothetical protein